MVNRPTNGSTYFYVTDDGSIGQSTWKDSDRDNERLKQNNAFQKRDDAQRHLQTSGQGSRSGQTSGRTA